MPVLEVLRQQGLPAEFPDRTEADLYILMTEHRLELEKELGAPAPVEQVASDLTPEGGLQGIFRQVRSRLGRRLPKFI